jgi:tRNA threonylcarbamoyladenosine modification (KEOPS) complex  Pcc1 subunit
MKAQTVIRLRFATERNLDVVMTALSPETKSASSRSRVRIDSTDGVLTLKFRASDTSALRAVVNSYLHWVLLVSDTFSRLESL